MAQVVGLLALFFFTVTSVGVQTGEVRQGASRATLRGRVTDANTGEPIAKVKVIVIGSEQSATTDDNGTFVLRGLPSGEVELYITTVGYGLVKKRVSLKESEETNLEVALQQEAAPLLGEVTVTAGPFIETETNVASEYSLNKPELRALSSILIADPIRAVQGLPGVMGNDDFRSEFAVRGAGFKRVGFFIDGLLLPENPIHTVYGHEDAGQLSMLNADTIASVSLLSGAFPSRYGDATAGLLQMETREGNRVKPAGRIAASLLSSSALFDGPLPKKRGAWLVTARKSYLNYALKVLSDYAEEAERFAIDFTDAQAKAVYDLTVHHQVGMTAILGRSDFDPSESRRVTLGPNDILKSNSRTSLIYAHWNYTTGGRLATQTRLFRLRGSHINENPDGQTLQDGHVTHLGVRADISFLAHPEHRIEAGVYLRLLHGEGFRGRFSSSQPPRFITQAHYDRRANQQGYYLQDTWSSHRFQVALTGGVRIDHTELTGQTVVMPRTTLSFGLREKMRVRLGWGQYSEFPDVAELFGYRGNPRLRAERATHYNVSVEQLIGDRTRIVAEFFDREDRDLLFGLNESYIKAGRVTAISFPLRNSLNGYARGFEVSMHRRSANRLTGWFSYTYSTTRVRDQVSGLSFVSDYDQRHTISTYGSYRLTSTFNLNAQWRYGSGLPMVGFFREEGGQVVLGSERNRVRLPAYSRVDVQIHKAFYLKRSKLTLSGEVVNLLGRDNFRQDGRSRQKLLPFLPSVGLSFEF